MARNSPQTHANARAKQGERCCFVSKQRLARHAMVRFVYDAEGALCLDAAEKLPGRGYWLAVEDKSLTQGLQRLLAKSKKRAGEAEVSNHLRHCVQVLEARCLSLLSLARRAGQAVGGFSRCRAQAEEGRLRALVCAEGEQAPDCAKLLGSAQARENAALFFKRFGAQALGKIFARDRTVYVGLCGTKPLARSVLGELERFDKFVKIFEARKEAHSV